MRRIAALAGIACLALSPATRAQPPGLTLELTYAAYAEGFTAVHMVADLTLTSGGYQLSLDYRTVAAVGFLFPGHDAVTADGTWRGDAAVPATFESEGVWGGHHYDVLIGYPDGSPEVQRLLPAQATRREPVPASLRRGTIDTGSAIALHARQVMQGGSCRLAARVFDGRRLMALAVQPAGTERLPTTSRSFFHGEAIRCDITGTLLAGFLHSDSPAQRNRVQHGAVWFAHPVAGLPLLPVRITFPTRWFGTATMYLTNVTAGPGRLTPVPSDVALAPPAKELPQSAAQH